jgi:hypothetical protein
MIPNSRVGIKECGHKDSVFNEIDGRRGEGGLLIIRIFHMSRTGTYPIEALT